MKIEVPSPCTQNWDKMQTVTNGKFCASCSKSVIDFTAYSNSQLNNFFLDHRANVCGRFRQDQLNATLINAAKQNYLPRFWHSIIAGIALLVFSSNSTLGRDFTVEEMPTQVKAPPGSMHCSSSIVVSDTCIKGKVMGDNQPLHGASVLIAGTSIGVATDTNGKFNLCIPELYRDKSFSLTISFVGYVTDTVVYTPYRSTEYSITLKADHYALTGEVLIVGGAYARRSFWGRAWRWITFWK